MNGKSIISTKINTKTIQNPVTISLQRRNVNMHYVFEHELDNLGTANIQASINLGLFGISFGAAVSLWITVLTVAFADQSTANLIIAIAVALSLLSVYLGARCYFDVRKARKQLEAIKENKGEPEIIEG
jgi:hypothetical protein